MQKVCKDCKIEKPVEDFYRHYNKKAKKSYYRTNCKLCENERSRKYHNENKATRSFQNKMWKIENRFGITIDKYESMLAAQDYGCKICQGNDLDRSLAIDHNHETGKVRGLLCSKCNRGLGYFQDNVELLQKAIDYLKLDMQTEIV